MERYTFMSDGYPAVDSASCYEDQNEDYSGPAIDKLAEFEDAQEEGRLWIAPCAMDTQMYRIVEGAAPHTRRRHKYIRVIYLSENNFFRVLRDFGKTVFLTLEEAQKALEGMKK